jgi:hypothetical protein
LASDDAPSASMAGLLGPGADAESLVLGLINRQDRYLARRTCHARRRDLGARTTTLVLSEDEAGKAVLPSVDLASSFPALRTLVLRCKEDAWERWPERFAAFISCNAAALQQLRHLDGYDYSATATSINSIILAALAQLPSLQSLYANVDRELSPPCWAALGSLKQLTGLRLYLPDSAVHPEHMQHIVDAAPQLQELWLLTYDSLEQLACLTGLRSLSSLELWVDADGAVVRSLTALQGLTHLALGVERPDGLLAAVGQLTGLVSLELYDIRDDLPLQPLAALQQLTSLTFRDYIVDEQEALALAGLGQLRRLVASFNSPAAAAAAELARREECKMDFNKGEEGEDSAEEEELLGGALIQAPGHLSTDTECLACFDLSSVHTLQLVGLDQNEEGELCQQLSRCQQLRALRLENVSSQLVLQAIRALPQLQHLSLSCRAHNPPLDCGRLAMLAGCSRQLRQLTLLGMADLAESALGGADGGAAPAAPTAPAGLQRCPEPEALPGAGGAAAAVRPAGGCGGGRRVGQGMVDDGAAAGEVEGGVMAVILVRGGSGISGSEFHVQIDHALMPASAYQPHWSISTH